jgi:dienelactone hydrolase
VDAAARLAALGYVGFALDMYGKGVFGADGDVALNSSLMNPLASDRYALRVRMQAALQAGCCLPQVDASKVAAIGYCFGGMCVLELARSGADVRGVVSIHGLLAQGEAGNEAVKAKVLCLHGHDDPMVPPEQVLKFEEEMTAAGADWQLHAYGNTLHGFTNPAATNAGSGTLYNEAAQKRAYLSMQNFLAEVFT